MGISCRGILDPLSDYLEGEAGQKVCAMIEEHLQGCEKCRMHVDSMKLVITLYKKWRDDTIPKDVSIRLRDRLAEEALRLGGAKPAGQPAKAKVRKPGAKASRKRPSGKPGRTTGKAAKGRAAPPKSRRKGSGKGIRGRTPRSSGKPKSG
jgi:hypothetical protein